MTGDVFEKHPSRLDFADDAGDFRPQVPFVIFALSLARLAEWLAGVACKDGVDMPAPRDAVEGADIVPDRGRGKVSGTLGGDDGLPRVFLPFDVAAGVKSGLCELQSHVEATAAGTQGQSVFGT